MLKHVEPLSEAQLLGIYNLQQGVQETEEALNQGMESLQHSLSDTVAAPEVSAGNFMGHMSLALNKIASMEAIVRQVRTSAMRHYEHHHPHVCTASSSVHACVTLR